jgi:hypothetical protein
MPNGGGMRRYMATHPTPGWTTRLIDIGRPLGITAVAAGKILELLGYRSNRHATDSAVAAGCGVRRWDGYAMHDDWHTDGAVSAIRSAAQARGNTAVADALAAAIGRRQGRERALARKRKEDEEKAAHRHEEEAVISGLRQELQTLRAADPGMSLLTAVEYVTPDPAHRIALYRCCAEDGDIQARGLNQDDPRLLKIASSSALDLAFLERRARGEGFQVQG